MSFVTNTAINNNQTTSVQYYTNTTQGTATTVLGNFHSLDF